MTVPQSRASSEHTLDYDLDEVVYVEDAAAMKAVADDTRMDILNLLLERAATVSQLADALDKPKGTVGYHAKILEDVGLIRVVRTAKVRAMTEKYYGRVGRTIQFRGSPRPDDPHWFVNDALRSMVAVEGDPLPMFTSRVARIPVERAVEFSERILELSEEFLDLPRSGDTVFGFLAGIFPTDHPALTDGGDSR
ncbi:MAG TPA: helix-turn-helix domain-containing protein [Acidimicrobiia bacterium]|nr:helix-turn-helix domain-containing protein [Acidimicrobiia bacterium]